MAVYRNSRYTKTSAYIKSGDTLTLESRQRTKISLKEATYYTVIQGDTIDGIAFNLYGNAQLYWVIMDCNPKYQSELEIKPGDVLVVPAFEEVVKYFE